MAKRLILLACPLALLVAPGGCSQPLEGPRLVVVIVVDQMRGDTLDRYEGRFVGGFSRLARAGRVYTDAHQDHAITDTSPGHAAIATGAFPGRCGVVGNSWWDRQQRRIVYSAEDLQVQVLGRPEARPASPANLQCETLGDWLKQASPASKVLSIALKDRPAVFLGGARADGAYWYDKPTGRWVTSTYYRDSYPEWVEAFNGSGAVDAYFDGGWTKLLDDSAYDDSREDAFAAESGGRDNTFPHGFPGDGRPDDRYYTALSATPHADDLTLGFVERAVVAEGLGADAIPDLLFVGLSAGDYVGHLYGPFSQEKQDHYLHLDRRLGDFLDFLERSFGSEEVLVALTSDHGMLPIPEELQRRGLRGVRLPLEELVAAYEAARDGAAAALGIEATFETRIANGLILQSAEPQAVSEEQMRRLRETTADALRRVEFIADTYTYDELTGGGPGGRPFLEEYRRVFHPGRAPDVMVRLEEYVLYPRDPIGTDHGSPYRYDTHVPLILHGPGIAPASVGSRVRAIDLAPTLAGILGIPVPADLDGRPLPLPD